MLTRVLAAIVLVLAGVAAAATVFDPSDEPPTRFEARVERVVDGDTVVLRPGGKTRLIGVDTPEVHGEAECFGREASAFTERRLDGRRVTAEVGTEARDRYGRLLAYLFTQARLFNAELVRAGYATPLTIAPNSQRAELFARAAREAREAGRGLWASC